MSPSVKTFWPGQSNDKVDEKGPKMEEEEEKEKPKADVYNIQLATYTSKQQEAGELAPTDPKPDVPVFRKLFYLYLWAFFLYFGYNCAIYMQEYLNKEQNLAIASQITSNAARTLATLLVGVFIKRIPMNWLVLLGTFLHVFYVMACFCPSWYTLIPAAVISGVGISAIGIAVYVFMASLGIHYQGKSGIDGYRLQTRIFLLYNVVLQCSKLAGYFVSYGILGSNLAFRLNSTVDFAHCGKDYCDFEMNIPQEIELTFTEQYWLCGMCLISVMIAFLILLFLEPLKTEGNITPTRDSPDGPGSTVSDSKLSLLQFLLFPANIITAVGSSFWFLDVVKAYGNCFEGPHTSLNNFLVYSSAFIVAAFIFGWFAHRYIRVQLSVFLLLKICLLVALILYKPEFSDMLLLFTSLWALSDGVLSPGFPAMYGQLCPDKLIAAFTSQQFWTSFGLFLVDLLSFEICTSTKLYMHTAYSVMALIEYIALEVRLHKKI